MTEIVDIYKEYVSEVRRNIQRAVLELGPYTLVNELSHHKVTSDQWMNMNKKQQEKHIKIIDPCYAEELEVIDSTSRDDTCLTGTGQFSNDFSESGLPEMFWSSWKNADSIIRKNGVASAPGTSNTKVVMSLMDPNKPHLVELKGGEKRLECDCTRFQMRSLCADTIAVAREMDRLDYLVSTWSPNLSKQLQ